MGGKVERLEKDLTFLLSLQAFSDEWEDVDYQ